MRALAEVPGELPRRPLARLAAGCRDLAGNWFAASRFSLGRRLVVAAVAALLASPLVVGMIIVPGVWFHLSIGGQL